MLDQTFYQELDARYAAHDAAGAEAYLRAALDEAWSDERNHEDRATVLNELLGHYRTAGDFEACDSVRKALLRELRALDLKDGPVYATFALNIANACRAMGRLDEAERLFLQVRDIYAREIEPGDFRQASLANNLGLTYRAKGDLASARHYLTEALTIAEALPDATAAVGATCSNLADLAIEQGDLDEAQAFADRAVATCSGDTGGVDLSAALAASARIAYRRGDFAAAADSYGKAADAYRRAFGEGGAYATLVGNRDAALAAQAN